MKKKILVYHPNPKTLSAFISLLPAFGAWHRNKGDNLFTHLRPYNTTLQHNLEYDDVLQNISTNNHTTAITGVTTQESVELYQNVYDLYVDLENVAVEVNAQQKKVFNLVKFHKNIIDTFLDNHNKLVEGDITDQTLAQGVIKSVMVKTKEIIGIVGQCKSEETGLVTPDSIKAGGVVPANLEDFIYAVAIAEGLTGQRK